MRPEDGSLPGSRPMRNRIRGLANLLGPTRPIHMVDPTIVFIHIPKTGGTSFRAAAEIYFGSSSVERDYGTDDPYTTDIVHETVYSNRIEALPAAMEQAFTRMLAGHFHAAKYLQLFTNRIRWCTFLRDPVQRVISEHRHLVGQQRYHHSLEYFCNTEAECNKQTRLMQGIAVEDRYFVGVAEHFRESIQAFNDLAGAGLEYTETNMARASLSDAYEVSDHLLQTIEANNSSDLALYSMYASRYSG